MVPGSGLGKHSDKHIDCSSLVDNKLEAELGPSWPHLTTVKGLGDEIGHIWTASNPFLTDTLNASDRQRNKLIFKMSPAFTFWQEKYFQLGTDLQAFIILRTNVLHHSHQTVEVVPGSLGKREWENMGKVGLPECWEIRLLTVNSEMGFRLEVTNWQPAG